LALGLLFGGAGAAFVPGLITLVLSDNSGRFWGLGIVLVSVAIGVIGFLNMNASGPAAAPVPANQEDAGTIDAEPAAEQDAGSAPPAAASVTTADGPSGFDSIPFTLSQHDRRANW